MYHSLLYSLTEINFLNKFVYSAKNVDWQKGAIRISKNLLITYLITFIVLSGTGLVFLFNPWSVKETEAAWFNDNWSYRKTLTFTHNATVSSATQVEFDIDTTDAPDKFQADCGDVRFTSPNGDILPYYYPGTDACDNAITDFDVLIPSIINGSNYIYMYYGNPSAQNGTEAADFSEATTTLSGGAATAGSEEKAPSPVAYWKFDDGQGTTAQDSSTNNKDATLAAPTATPTWQTEDMCISGKCLSFDGSNDYAAVSTPNLPTGDFTYSVWINPVAVGDNAILMASDGNGFDEFLLKILSGQLSIKLNGAEDIANAAGSFTISTNTWTHVAVTRSGNDIRYYFNGNMDADTGDTTVEPVNFGSCELLIGADEGAACNSSRSRYFNGKIDDIKIYNQALSAAQIKANYNSRSNPEGVSTALGSNTQNMPGALSNGLVGYWEVDEGTGTTSTVDSSGNGYTATLNGTPPWAGGKYGNALTYGTSRYLDMGDVLDPGTSDLSITAWVKTTEDITSSSDFGMIVSKRDSSSTSHAGYQLFQDDSDKLSFTFGDGSATRVRVDSTGPAINDGIWHFVAVTFDRDGNGQLYVDGVPATGGSGSIAAQQGSIDTAYTLRIGKETQTNHDDYDATIDETRIYKRALSGAEVSQLYYWAPGPVGYWKMDEGSGTSAFDSSGNANNGTLTNSPSYQPGKYNEGLFFDGSSATNNPYVTVPAATNINDLGPLTYSAWVKPVDAGPNGDGMIINKGEKIGFSVNGSPCRLQFMVDYATTDLQVTTTGGTLNCNQWSHVALTWDGSTTATNVHIFINGTETTYVTQTNGSGSRNSDNTDAWLIGNRASLNRDFNGTIDDVRGYNYIRTQAQIISDMNAGHPAPGSPVGTPYGHWRFDEGAFNSCASGADACNSGNGGSAIDGTETNMASASPTSGYINDGKYGKAIKFDGSNDGVLLGDISGTDGVSQATWSLWIRPDALGTQDCFWCKVHTPAGSPTLSSWGIISDSSDSSIVRAFIANGASDISQYGSTPTGTLTNGTWTYIAVVYDGNLANANRLKIYKDGIPLTTTITGTIPTTISNTAASTAFGRAPNVSSVASDYDGGIDEAKLYLQALTAEQIKLDMNRGASQVMGALSTSSDVQSNSAASEYCPPDSSAAICTGPVAEWKLDEGSGTTAQDTSGNANTGTITAGTGSYANGKLNKAYNFDGANSLINAGSGTTLDDLPAMTLEAWVYPRSVGEGNNAFLLNKNAGVTQSSGWIFHYTANNGLLFVADGSSDIVRQSANSVVPLNRWSHITLTWNGVMATASSVRMYVNGVEVSYQTTTNGANRVSDAARNLYIGNDSTQNRTFNGLMDQVKVFNYVRTPSQIAWDYNKGAPIAHWRMDECQGTTINDVSGNNKTGTLTLGASGITSAGTCTTSASTSWGHTSGTGAGKRNFSVDLDGTDDYISVSSPVLPTGDFTYTAWINPDSTTDETILMAGNNTANENEFYMHILNGALRVRINDTLAITASTTLISTGTWTHVVVTRSGSTLNAYFNAIQDATTGTEGTTLDFSTCPLFIGHDIENNCTETPADRFNGKIDDVRVYNYGLTATQVRTLYNEGATRFGPTTGAP